MAAQSVRLKPQWELLNPDFEGYKLYSDGDVTAYSRAMPEGVACKASQSTCYLHTRLHALHNHLFRDPFHSLSVYFFNNRGHLVKCSYSLESRLSEGEVVWQVGVGLGEAEEDQHFHPTLSFPSQDLALVTDGRGRLTLLQTGDRTATRTWLVSFESEVEKGVIADACLRGGEGELHCLLVSVTTPQSLQENPKYVVTEEALGSTTVSSLHLVHWMSLSPKGASWEISRTRTVAGRGALEYCAVDEAGTGLMLLCHSNYMFVSDSAKPITRPDPQPGGSSEKPKFTFQQSGEVVTVWLNVGKVTKEELKVKITESELKVSVEERPFLQGHLLHPVHPHLATWTLDEGKLEVLLPKASEGERWSSLFAMEEGVSGEGEEILEPGRVEEINQGLAHLTSHKLDPDPTPEKPAYDPEQLEDCDQASEDLLLLHLNGSSHQLTHYGQLGATQHLFNLQVGETSVPAFCIRHDVDAVLWQPGSPGSFTHESTYHAFGYVRASKTTAKFTCGSPDLSYVAVADVRSHVYVFLQPEALEGEVRNRKSGHRLHKMARQLVLSLKTHSEVLGLYTSPSVLFVLTDKMLYAYCVRSS